MTQNQSCQPKVWYNTLPIQNSNGIILPRY